MNDFGLNQQLLIWINQDWANPVFDVFFQWLSAKASFSIPLLGIIIVIIGYRFGKSGWLFGLLLILVTSISDLLGNSLKDLFQHARPCLQMHDFIRFPKGGDTYCESSISGMPSNHAMNFFATFSFICFFFPQRQVIIPSLILTVLVGISRIYLGEHYPSQVITGAIFGSVLGLSLAVLCAKGLKRRLHFHET